MIRNARKMSWVLVAWTAFFAWWVFGGLTNADCTNSAYPDACLAGAGVGVMLVIGLWFIGFVVLSIVWFMSRPKA